MKQSLYQSSYKDAYNMVFKLAILTSAVVAMAAQDSLVQKQDSLLSKLTQIANSNSGVSFGGIASSGYLGSSEKSGPLKAGSPTSETQAFSEMDLGLMARPTADSRAIFKLRLHQDWQTTYAQGVNPVLFHWASYDGLSMGKTLKFNIGDMRVAYSPLTMWTPQVELLQEPEFFKEMRLKSMDYRNLDTSNGRLMEGANMDYNSGTLGFIDNLQAQGTLARLRNSAKKADEVFFDYDRADEYSVNARVGVDAAGGHLGASYTSAFDRIRSTLELGVNDQDTVNFNDNSVISLQFGYNTKSLFPSADYVLGIGGEYAMSKWTNSKYAGVLTPKVVQTLYQDERVAADGGTDSTAYIVNKATISEVDVHHLGDSTLNGTSLLLNVFGKGNVGELVDYNVKLNYLKSDKKFQSDLAMSPLFVGGQNILNSDATLNLQSGLRSTSLVNNMRSGSLENMYYTVYQSVPLTQQNLFAKSGNAVGATSATETEYYRLYNNYQMVHTYRNGYNNVVLKRGELETLGLDPSVSMALPFGYATPNRSGVDLKADLKFIQAVELNLRYATFSEDSGASKFTDVGAGLGVNVAKLANISSTLNLSGSYQTTSESNGFGRKSTRLMAGIEVGIWKGLSLIGNYQALSREFGTMYVGYDTLPVVNPSTNLPVLDPTTNLPITTISISSLTKTSETLLLVGPRIKITEGSTFTAQYGLMSNKINYISANLPYEIKLDKTLITADVTVNF